MRNSRTLGAIEYSVNILFCLEYLFVYFSKLQCVWGCQMYTSQSTVSNASTAVSEGPIYFHEVAVK